MISEIYLESFKCFERLTLPMNSFTLLTGLNGGGKSTILQALLLIQQSLVENPATGKILLSGSIVNLGTIKDVVDKVNGVRKFKLGFTIQATTSTWTFEGDRNDEDGLSIPIVAIDWRSGDKKGQLKHPKISDVFDNSGQWPAQIIKNIKYVPADRISPRETFPLDDLDPQRSLGHQGEKSIGLLYWLQSENIDNDLQHPNESRPTLLHQLEAWINTIFPGVNIDIQRIRNTNKVSLGIRTSNATDFHRPQHVGFGITHVLPIIIGCLVSLPGELIVVENPETHLHPRAQVKIAHFLAVVAASGRQVIVESHSDHILNGVRRAVASQTLGHDAALIHFFRPRDNRENEPQVEFLTLDAKGGIDHWPQGFFDQIDEDLMALSGLK